MRPTSFLHLLFYILLVLAATGVSADCDLPVGNFSHSTRSHQFVLQPHMLRRSQSKLGSLAGLHRFIGKLHAGLPVTLSVVGGSISKGCGGDRGMRDAYDE